MRIGDIYKHKKYGRLVSIYCFIKDIKGDNELKIVIAPLGIVDDTVAYCDFSNIYGTQEEIEEQYEVWKHFDIGSEMQVEKLEEEIKEYIENLDIKEEGILGG